MNFLRDEQVSILWRLAGVLSTCAACLALSGCGNGLAQVSGHVTIDGQPLRGGSGDVRVTVQFQPASGTGTTAIGLADENGNYSLGTGSQAGIPPGDYAVSCTAIQLVPAQNPGGTPGGRHLTEPKYADAKTSGLRFIVEPGKNEFDIPLTSAPKAPSRPGS